MGDSTFLPNIIIYADDGKFYLVEEKTWKQTELPDEAAVKMKQLVRDGVVVATVPTSGPGIGSLCYLVNLASLKVPGSGSDSDGSK